MIVSVYHTMHPQSPALTIGRTVLIESDDLDISGVTIEKHLLETSSLRVPRTASQRLSILRKSW